jgi:hypothetical protein
LTNETPEAKRPVALTPSVTQLERSRALPKLSFRFMLTVVTLAAVVAFILRLSDSGSAVAIAVLYSLGSAALCFALFAVLFLIAWIPAVIGRDVYEDVHVGNPFADDQLPPQILPPREPGA